MRPNKNNDLSNFLKSASLITNFGLTMGAAVLIGYYFGSYIDSKLKTEPWFMLVFLILFIAGGFIKFFQETGEVGRSKEKRNAGADKQG